MIDFNILRGLSTELFSAPGVVNPDLIIEEGYWYLCTDTAELFLGIKEQNRLVLKKINANLLDGTTVSIINLKIVNGNLIATYSDESVVDLGKVVEVIPTNISAFTNDAGYATEQFVTDAIAANVPINDLVKKEEVVEVKTKLEEVKEEVLPIIPTVQELAKKAATQEWVEEQGYLTAHSLDGLATEDFVTQKIAEAELADKPVDISSLATKEELAKVEAKIPSVEGLASEQFVADKIAEIELPEVPVKVSELENDLGYVTEEALNETAATINSQIQTIEQTYVTNKTLEQNYITQQEIANTYVTEQHVIDNYVTQEAANSTYITNEQVTELVTNEINTVVTEQIETKVTEVIQEKIASGDIVVNADSINYGEF